LVSLLERRGIATQPGDLRLRPGVESFLSQGVIQGRKVLRILHIYTEGCKKTPRGFK
jgi:hypothetical protein